MIAIHKRLLIRELKKISENDYRFERLEFRRCL